MSKLFGKDFESMASVVSAMDGVNIIQQSRDSLSVKMSSACLEDFESKLEKSSFHQVGSLPTKYFISQKQKVEVFIAAPSTKTYDEEMDTWYRRVEIYQLGD